MTDQVQEFEEKRLGRPFKVTAADDTGTFQGHGAVFNELHGTSSWRLPPDWQDRIMPGAFGPTLERHAARGTLPPMLYMHQRGNVVGAWREMAEDKDGLAVKGQVALSAKAPSGAGLYELLKLGALNAMSIGFRPTRVELDEKAKIRTLYEVELGELSLVDVPGIPSARVTDVKLSIRSLEETLHALGLSRAEAKALLANGYKGIAQRDAGAVQDERAQRDAAADGEGKERDATLIAPVGDGEAAAILKAMSRWRLGR